MKRKLSIGLLMDSYNICAWEYSVIDKIIKSNYASIDLVVLNNSEQESKLKKGLTQPQKTGYGLYIIFDKMLDKMFGNIFSKNNPDAFELKKSNHLLQDVPLIKATPLKKQFSDFIQNEDIQNIKNYNIEVFIRFGFRILRGEILKASKYGIWSLHHGDNTINRGGPPGFWEVMNGWPVTGSILQILDEKLDSGKVIYRSYSLTSTDSVHRNKNNLYWKTESFLPRMLSLLYTVGEHQFFKKLKKENEHPFFYSRPLYKTPGNFRIMFLILKQGFRFIRRLFRRWFRIEYWFLMYDIKEDMSTAVWKFKKIFPPKDRFWADPHIFFKDDKYYIYIEEFIYKTGKGHISFLVLDKNGNYSKPVKVLDRPYHLSYPFLFEWQGNNYMIPESYNNNTIELYKCIDFPLKWEFQKNLFENIAAVDSTLFEYNNKWWLFTNIRENKGASALDELFLFYADTPVDNNWVPHPLNPIISDVRKARPAGKIFTYNGNIYRPSQNSSWYYGYGIKINQIVTLTETQYEEVEVNSIEPKWDKNIIGVHTINYTNNLTIIDGVSFPIKFF